MKDEWSDNKIYCSELIWKMIQGHVIGFAPAYALDRAAEPLQQDGIPIICNDVPKIP